MAINVLIVGAGAVGRGLLAPLLLRAGHAITFVDNNLSLAEQLKGRLYYPALLKQGGEIGLYGPCRSAAVIPSLDKTDLVFVSVRVENFLSAGQALGSRLRGRTSKKPLPIIVCENTPNAAEKFSAIVGMRDNVFYRSAIAETIIPEIPKEIASVDPLLTYIDPNGHLIVDGRDWQGEKITASGIQYSDNFVLDWELKWFCHCAIHLIVALSGHRQGISYIHQAIAATPQVTVLSSCIIKALTIKYPGYSDKIEARMKYEFDRLIDATRPDVCSRVIRDLSRKLQPQERFLDTLKLVGANSFLDELLKYAWGLI